MMQNARKTVLDFSHVIEECTQHFIGREWVFKAIDDWLNDRHGPRFFLLEGEPGSGKTAVAGQLSQISQGVVAQEGLAAVTRNFLSAVHFCNARDTFLIDPFTFVNSFATQLANHYPDYLNLLIRQRENHSIHIDVQQNVQQVVSGQVIGMIINVSSIAPESAFNCILREPLEILLREKPNEQIIFLVDALDEALAYSSTSNIATLLARVNGLSPRVRFILTTRSEEQVNSEFTDARKLSLSIPHDQRCQKDISQYVQLRLKNDISLIEKVVQADHYQSAHLTKILPLKADGNFQFVRFLLDSIAQGLRGSVDLEGLPTGLNWLYFDSLRRVVQLKGRDWFTTYRPLMGILAVAQESLTIVQLQAFTSQSEEAIWQYLSDLQQFIEEVKSQDERGTLVTRYRLFHESFHDYLHSQPLIINGEHVRNIFFISKIEWHKTLANTCEGSDLSKIWEEARHLPLEQSRREYARREYITHLYFANEWQRLFAVLDEGQYGHAKERYALSTRSYIQDLDRGLQAAMNYGVTLKEQISMLPYIWRYSLLRGSLRSVVNDYPQETLQLLLLLGREAKVLSYVEFLTDPSRKAEVLLMIGRHMATRIELRDQFLLQAFEVSRTIEEEFERALILISIASELKKSQKREQSVEVLMEVEQFAQSPYIKEIYAKELAKAQHWEQGAKIARSIGTFNEQVEALRVLSSELAKAQHWAQAEQIARSIVSSNEQAEALIVLASELANNQRWAQAEQIARSIQNESQKIDALLIITNELVKAQQWKQAAEIVRSIQILTDTMIYDNSLRALASSLVKAWQHEQAAEIWEEVKKKARKVEDNQVLEILASELAKAQHWEEAAVIAHSIKDYKNREEALLVLSSELAKAQYWAQAEQIARSIESSNERAEALIVLASELANDQRWEQAAVLLEQVAKIARSTQNEPRKIDALLIITNELVKAQQYEQATELCKEIEQLIHTIPSRATKAIRIKYLITLASALAKNQQKEWAVKLWNEAGQLVRTYPDDYRYARDRSDSEEYLVHSLIEAQQMKLAVKIAKNFKKTSSRDKVLRDLVNAFSEAQQWEQAAEVARLSSDRVKALNTLASIMIEARYSKQAEKICAEIESIVRQIPVSIFLSESLSNLVSMLAKDKQWKMATEVARSIQNEPRKIDALLIITNELVKAQQWKQAAEIVRSIQILTDTMIYDNSLRALASSLVKAWQHEQAAEIWEEVKKKARKVEDNRVLEILASELAKARHWEEAAVIAHSIKDYKNREEALLVLLSELAKAQHWEEAVDIVSSFSYGGRLKALLVLSSELAKAQHWEEAADIAHFIESDEERAMALLVLSSELFGAQHWEVAAEAWKEAEKVAQTFEHSSSIVLFEEEYSKERYRALDFLMRSLTKARRWKQAAEIARCVDRSDERTIALGVLASELTKAQQWEQAAKFWKEAEKAARSCTAIVEVESREGLAWFEDTLRFRKKVGDHDYGLDPLILYLAEAKQWDHAIKLASKSIHGYERSNKLLSALSSALVRAQQWKQATDVARLIHDKADRAKSLILLAGGLTESQQWELAAEIWKEFEKITQTLVTSKDVIALKKITTALLNAEEYQRLVQIIQFSWKQIESNDDAFCLFSLALDLLSLSPGLSIALHQGFQWVDAFLREDHSRMGAN